MAKERSHIRNALEFLGVRVLIAVLQSMSLRAGYALARGLAFLAYHVDRRHRLVAEQNLQIAYPHWTTKQRNRVVKDVYLHFCQMVIEMAHLPRLLHVHNWRRYLELRNGEATINALLSERPIVVVTGHLGNWEMAGYALALFGFRSYAVARPLDNPWLDALVKRFRKKTGQELLNKNGDAPKMEQVLRSNGILCTLADQDAGPNGLFVPFFGKPASTHKAVALLALHHEALVMVAAARRVGDGLKYALDVETIIDTRDLKDEPNPVRTLTEQYTAAWERLVCKAPEQYLWLHRRWKHEPRRKATHRQAA